MSAFVYVVTRVDLYKLFSALALAAIFSHIHTYIRVCLLITSSFAIRRVIQLSAGSSRRLYAPIYDAFDCCFYFAHMLTCTHTEKLLLSLLLFLLYLGFTFFFSNLVFAVYFSVFWPLARQKLFSFKSKRYLAVHTLNIE